MAASRDIFATARGQVSQARQPSSSGTLWWYGAMVDKALGIDIGSTTLKLCLLSQDGGVEHAMLAHEGDLPGTLAAPPGQPRSSPRRCVGIVTGTEGRHRIPLPEVIAAVAIESGLEALELKPRAVVSMGGEDLVVYILNGRGHIVNTYAGNKCASGTGEFLRQQLGRMNLKLEDINEICAGASVHRLSARCSRVHEVGLHAPAEQGRGDQGGHRAVAEQGDGGQGRGVPDQGEDRERPGRAHRRRHAQPPPGRLHPRRAGRGSISSCPARRLTSRPSAPRTCARSQGAMLPEGELVRPGAALAFKTFRPLSESGDLVRSCAVAAGRLRSRGRVRARRRRRLDDHEGRADQHADARDRRRALRPHARRPGRRAEALPARGQKAAGRHKPRITPRRDHRLVARAPGRLPRDDRRLQRDHRAHRRARPTSRRTSTPSSRSAARTRSTSSSTTASPSTTR